MRHQEAEPNAENATLEEITVAMEAAPKTVETAEERQVSPTDQSGPPSPRCVLPPTRGSWRRGRCATGWGVREAVSFGPPPQDEAGFQQGDPVEVGSATGRAPPCTLCSFKIDPLRKH